MKEKEFYAEMKRVGCKIKANMNTQPDLAHSATNTFVDVLTPLSKHLTIGKYQALGKKRKGSLSPLKRAIRHICRQLANSGLNAVLKYLESDKFADSYYSTREANKVDIQIQEVSFDSKHISYITRAGKEKSISFHTLANYISELK